MSFLFQSLKKLRLGFSDIKLYEKGDDFQQLYLISITYQGIFKDTKLYIIEYKDGRLGIQQEFFEVI